MWYGFIWYNVFSKFTTLADMTDFEYFAFHCQYAYLNDSLKNYLCSLEVPCPKFLMIGFEVLPPWDNAYFRKFMWYFLRTLSRKVGAIRKTQFVN